jgi:hypothetical protein
MATTAVALAFSRTACLGALLPVPDAAQPQFAGLSMHGTVSEFTLGRIEHYTAVILSAKPGP